MSLSGESLSKLLVFVPSLVTWLWQKNPNDAANILATLGPSRLASKETSTALLHLLSLPPLSALSTAQIRESLTVFPHDVWYRVLFILLSNAESPLVSRNCYTGLVELKEEIAQGLDDEDELLEEAWTVVERLPLDCYQALGDVCTLVKETSTNAASLSKLIGPRLLLPEGHESVVFKRMSGDQSRARSSKASSSLLTETTRKAMLTEEEITQAAELFEFLVTRSEDIFFKYSPRTPPVGYRNRLVNPVDPAIDQKRNRISQLQQFYKLVDEKHIKVAEQLFSLYTFSQIAEAIWAQYHFLPEFWIEDLVALSSKNPKDEHLVWFEQNRSSIVEISMKNLSVYTPSEKSYVPVSKGGPSRVVEEVLTTEKNYSLRMRKFFEIYVRNITQISMGGRGDKAKKKLGLTDKEVRQIFGKKFDDVINSVESFLVELEVLRLIRGPVLKNPNTGVSTRAGVLAQIILEHGTKLISDYKEYNSIQMENVQLIGAKTLKAKSDWKDSKAKNFMEIWTEVSEKDDEFRGLTIERILLLPSKRFSDYKLMLERMFKFIQKSEQPSEPDLNVIHQAMSLCDKVCGGLNDAIRTNSKAAKLLGKNL